MNEQVLVYLIKVETLLTFTACKCYKEVVYKKLRIRW